MLLLTNVTSYFLKMLITADDSTVNDVREEMISGKNGVVMVSKFQFATIEDMQHNLKPILERDSCCFILLVGTNNAESCTHKEIFK